jgi:hypothetical protein
MIEFQFLADDDDPHGTEDGVGTEYYFVVARNNQHLVSSYFATDASDIH